MAGTTVFLAGAAGVSPMPAVVARPYGPRGVVRMAPVPALMQGTGLSFGGSTAAIRLWAPAAGATGSGVSAELLPTSGVVGTGVPAQHTTENIPGDLPPRDPLS